MENDKYSSTINKSIAWLLNNSFMSDVTFDFGMIRAINGNQIQNEQLHAHSLILCTRSPVFANQLNESEFKSVIISVTDVSLAIYYEFLSFIYTDDCEITTKNVDVLVELAEQHCVTGLEEQCYRFMMKNNVSLEKVFKKLENDLSDQLSEDFKIFTRENIRTVIRNPQFPNINRNVLEIILRIEKLNIAEIEIFNATMQWAERGCQRLRIEVNSINKRTILGDLLKLIRFPIMTQYEFGQLCIAKERELLTTQEIGEIILEITDGKRNSMGFINKKRRTYPLQNEKIILEPNNRQNTEIAMNKNLLKNESPAQFKQICIGNIDNSTKTIKHSYGEFIAKFEINKSINLKGLQIGYSKTSQECRIQISDYNELYIFDGNFSTISNFTTDCYFNCQSIALLPDTYYTIKIKFKFPCDFSLNEVKIMPYNCGEDVKFKFYSLSEIINIIYYTEC